MKGLEEVYLRNIAMISDVTLGNLSKCKELRVLDINGSTCSLNGVARLKKLLPDCEIRFMGAVH
jgi:Ran GTPase-activating protein (RanGAP) involved in mRNA processing and transport